MQDETRTQARDADQLLRHAERAAPEFERLIEGSPYEERGILFSEMLFLYAAVGSRKPDRILESGRARGQSTFVLGRTFPSTRIVSVEFERGTPDAAFAEQRFRDVANVELLYGDAREILPRRVRAGDVVLIDGPKGFRAVRLALRLLAGGRPWLVFVHDVYRGTPERQFLERHLPGAFFSDHPEFVKRYARLDEPCWAVVREKQFESWKPYEFFGMSQASYGPTMACLPCDLAQSYRRILACAVWADMRLKARRSLEKRLGRKGI